MKLCDYGCGQEATYQFKNGKWCCKKYHSQCPSQKKQNSLKVSGIKHPMYGTKQSVETKNKNSLSNKKKWKDKTSKFNSIEYKQKLSIAHKLTIKQIKSKHLFFSKIEEMRYNPNKPDENEIQVHCKNHNCPNSKEQNGWFTPTGKQFKDRKDFLENEGEDKSCFYCSDGCKQTCPLYNLQSDPFKEIAQPYTQEEYQVWREAVLKQDNYECQKCGSKKDLHCHHIIPIKIEPIFSVDPDNGIVLCKECHYKYGHKTGTECSTGNLAVKQCRGNKL